MHDLDVISSESTDQNCFCMLMPCVLHLYEGAFDGRQQCVQCLSTLTPLLYVASFLRNIVSYALNTLVQSKALQMSCVLGKPCCLAQEMTSKHATLHIDKVQLSCCHPAATAQRLISPLLLGRQTHPCVPGACHQAHDVVAGVHVQLGGSQLESFPIAVCCT